MPVLANLQPSGRFLMDDLYRAGGVLALLEQVKDLLQPGADHRHRHARWSTTSTAIRCSTTRSSFPATRR